MRSSVSASGTRGERDLAPGERQLGDPDRGRRHVVERAQGPPHEPRTDERRRATRPRRRAPTSTRTSRARSRRRPRAGRDDRRVAVVRRPVRRRRNSPSAAEVDGVRPPSAGTASEPPPRASRAVRSSGLRDVLGAGRPSSPAPHDGAAGTDRPRAARPGRRATGRSPGAGRAPGAGPVRWSAEAAPGRCEASWPSSLLGRGGRRSASTRRPTTSTAGRGRPARRERRGGVRRAPATRPAQRRGSPADLRRA